MGKQRIVLKYKSHLALARIDGEQVASVLRHAAGVRVIETGQDTQESRLAGSGRTQQGKKLARRDRQTDIVQCREFGKAAAQMG